MGNAEYMGHFASIARRSITVKKSEEKASMVNFLFLAVLFSFISSQVDAKHFLIQTQYNKDDLHRKIIGTCVDLDDCERKCQKEVDEYEGGAATLGDCNPRRECQCFVQSVEPKHFLIQTEDNKDDFDEER